MRPAWHIAISSLAGRKGRSSLLVLAVALATALSLAISTAVAILGGTLRELSGRVVGLSDLVVRHRFDEPLPPDDIAAVQAWDEVAILSARLHVAATLNKPGSQTRAMLLLQGIDPVLDVQVHPVNMLQGRMPQAVGEIALDQRATELLEAKPGDVLEIAREGDPVHLTMVGTYERPALAVLQRPMAKLMLAQARQISGQTGADTLEIRLKPGVSAEAVQQKREKDLPRDAVFHTPASVTSHLTRGLKGADLLIQIITAVVFLCAGFIVLTSLTTAVTQQLKVLATLRCIGASRSQIAVSQLLTGLIVCGLGVMLGAPLGILGAYGLYRSQADLFIGGFSVSPTGILAAVLAAIAAGLLGSMYPAILAARVSPLDAMVHRSRPARMSGIFACLALGLAGAALVPGFLVLGSQLTSTAASAGAAAGAGMAGSAGASGTGGTQGTNAAWLIQAYVAVGLPITILGYFLLGVPVLVALVRFLSPVLARGLRVPPPLLTQTLSATPYRHGLTGGTLMVALALLTSIWTDGRSIMGNWFDRIQMPDAFVHGFVPLGPKQIDRLKNIPAITAVCPSRMFDVRLADIRFGLEGVHSDTTQFVASDIETFLTMTSLQWIEGDPQTAVKRLRQGRALLVSREYLVAHGIGAGNKLTLLSARGEPIEFEVVGVIASPGLDVAVHFFGIHSYYNEASLVSVFGTREDAKKYFGVDSANLILLKLREDLSDEEALKQIRTAEPMLIAGSARMIRRNVHAVAQNMMTLASSIALSAMVIACFGVGNLMIANLTARRFEFGVLRAMGARRGMLLRLILAEAVVIALVGSILGTALGLQFSLVASYLRERMFGLKYATQLNTEVALLGSFALVAAAVLASLPAALQLMRMPARELLASER